MNTKLKKIEQSIERVLESHKHYAIEYCRPLKTIKEAFRFFKEKGKKTTLYLYRCSFQQIYYTFNEPTRSKYFVLVGSFQKQSEMLENYRKDTKDKIVCKTTMLGLCRSKNIKLEESGIEEMERLKNPHFSCAKPMCLYDIRILEYY